MKSTNKKYFWGLLVLVLLIGGLIARPLMSWFNPTPPNISTDSFLQSSYPGPDVTSLAQQAEVIVIAEVKKVGNPYLPQGEIDIFSREDVNVSIKEVLKGDPSMTDITLVVKGRHLVVKSANGEIKLISKEDAENFEPKEDDILHFLGNEVLIFQPQEKVLLFLKKTVDGDYYDLGGPVHKYLIDETNMVSNHIEGSQKYFINARKNGPSIPLEKLKLEIQKALQLPAKEHITIPVEEMY